MKTKLFLLFTAIAVVLIPIAYVAAFFVSSVKMGKFSFSTGFWGAPAAPLLVRPINDLKTREDQYFEWNEPLGISFQPVTYKIEVYDADPLIYFDPSHKVISQEGIYLTRYPAEGAALLIDGDYWWRVKAIDAHGKDGLWSGIWKFSLDKTPPLTTISVENSPRRKMNEQINDGTFEKYPTTEDVADDFGLSGEVSLDQTGGYTGEKMIRIGKTNSQNEGLLWENSKLSYTFPNDSKTISFYYNLYSSDIYPFDESAFIVNVNDQPILQVGADETSGIGEVQTTGWRQFYYDISDLDNVKIDFFAGNSEDIFMSSWVYLDDIQTGRTVVNEKAKFYLESTEDGQRYYCVDDCDGSSVNWQEYADHFSLNLAHGAHNLFFYSTDELGNQETPKVKFIYFDNSPPQKITDLNLKNVATDSAEIVFTAPAQDAATESGKVEGFEIKYSESVVTDASTSGEINDWWQNALPVNTVIIPDYPGFAQEFVIGNLFIDKTYFAAIRSHDAAVNYSDVSNILKIVMPTPTPTLTLTPTLTPEPTVTPTETPIPEPTIENILVTPTPTPTLSSGLLQNGGFEDEINFWGDSGSISSIISNEKHSGNNSVLVTVRSDTFTKYLIHQRIQGININKKYRVSGYIKSGLGLNGSIIRIGWYGDTGTQKRADDSTIISSSDWTLAIIDKQPPSGATQMEVRLSPKGFNDIFDASAYFDDITVEEHD